MPIICVKNVNNVKNATKKKKTISDTRDELGRNRMLVVGVGGLIVPGKFDPSYWVATTGWYPIEKVHFTLTSALFFTLMVPHNHPLALHHPFQFLLPFSVTLTLTIEKVHFTAELFTPFHLHSPLFFTLMVPQYLTHITLFSYPHPYLTIDALTRYPSPLHHRTLYPHP